MVHEWGRKSAAGEAHIARVHEWMSAFTADAIVKASAARARPGLKGRRAPAAGARPVVHSASEPAPVATPQSCAPLESVAANRPLLPPPLNPQNP
jgi:hypothetical protein